LWDGASRLRRDDWRVSIAHLVDEPCLGDDDDHLMHLGADERAVTLATFDAEGAPRDVREIARDALEPHIHEYLTIIKRMHHEASAHMHTLDMAKKVVHDAGAKTLARVLPDFARDHESYRRLFSLVLAIVVDVTKLPGATAHRKHG
jgi:hypothetical protein